MYNRREDRIRIFEDTMQLIKVDRGLSDAVAYTQQNTKIFQEGQTAPLPNTRNNNCRITVTKSRSFEAAINARREYHYARICVLNFASATNPGGGVKNGSTAQEESLCRSSTLYPALNTEFLWKNYYTPNRENHNPIHSDVCIYTPDIVICRSDDGSSRKLGKDERVKVDVITCAAPNLRKKPGNAYNPEYGKNVTLSFEQQYRVHLSRAKNIMHTAALNNTDILILGAFGCGAFENDPRAVARAMNDSLKEYSKYFAVVEFAVYCTERDMRNYNIFAKTIER